MNELEKIHKICAMCSGAIRLYVPMDKKNVHGCDMFMPRFRIVDEKEKNETHMVVEINCFCSEDCLRVFKRKRGVDDGA